MRTSHVLALAALSGWTSLACAQSVPADLILHGGKIVTLDKRSSVVQAVAIRDGKFLAVGSDAEMKRFAGSGTKTIDLGGRTVVPGLNDSHTHFRAAGLALYTVNMRNATSVAQALAAVREFAAKKKPGEWVIGGAWHPPSQLAEKRYLTRQEIDSVVPDNPVFVPTVGHFVMGNSRALQIAGITRDTPNPEGGTIERDPATKEPTGVLIGAAIGLLARAVPDWTMEEQITQYRAGMRFLNSNGITSTIEGGIDSPDVRVLRHIVNTGQQTVRVGVMYRPDTSVAADPAKWEQAMKANGASSGFGDEWLRFAGVKLAMDGGMTLRTALTRSAYPNDQKYFGMAYLSPERFAQLIEIADRYGWRVGVHVVGDKATDVALDAFEALDRKSPIAKKRFILIHASLMQRDQMERAKKLGMRADVQNIFMWDRAATVERFLGRETADRAVPTRTLIDIMAIENLGAGTDYPVNTVNPFLNMYVMITRKDPQGTVYGAKEAVSREEALRLYTTSPAHYTFEESVKGSIEPGKLADLVVLSADPLTVPEESIKDITALTTIVVGRVVFQR